MRTRIALVAIIPVALITVSTLAPTAIAWPARVTPSSITQSSRGPVPLPASAPAAYRGAPHIGTAPTGTSPLVQLDPVLDGQFTAGRKHAAVHVAPPAPAGPVDTVTPDQRAAWERVAMCEESGDWHADGGMFSGGLGISRANWIAYGGGEFAPEGAMATEDQQIMVAERIQSSAPDQYGCHGW